MKFYVIFGIVATLAVQAALADDTKDSATAATSAATTVAASKLSSPSGDAGYKFSLIPNSYGAALAAGGAAVVAIVALLAVAAVISPLFGFRLCQLFSTCDLPPGSAGQYAASDYPGYSATGTPFGGSGYQKRSIEYVGPILQALNSAYEKYGRGGASPLGLNFKNINSEHTA